MSIALDASVALLWLVLETNPAGADYVMAKPAVGDTLNLARRYQLSDYDAAYLELALRTGLPLATLDADPAKAATTAAVPVFGTH